MEGLQNEGNSVNIENLSPVGEENVGYSPAEFDDSNNLRSSVVAIFDRLQLWAGIDGNQQALTDLYSDFEALNEQVSAHINGGEGDDGDNFDAIDQVLKGIRVALPAIMVVPQTETPESTVMMNLARGEVEELLDDLRTGIVDENGPH